MVCAAVVWAAVAAMSEESEGLSLEIEETKDADCNCGEYGDVSVTLAQVKATTIRRRKKHTVTKKTKNPLPIQLLAKRKQNPKRKLLLKVHQKSCH